MKKKPLPASLNPETETDLRRTIEDLSKPTPRRKSTKSTFKLTERGYERLNELAVNRGISVGALLGKFSEFSKNFVREGMIAIGFDEPIQGKRIRRSYAVARETLAGFQAIQDQIAKVGLQITRDDFIESMINLYWEGSEKSKQERIEGLKSAREVYRKMRKEWSDGVSKMRGVLSCEHAVFDRLNIIDIIMDNLDMAITSEIEGEGFVDPSDL